ncbi:hypothetical protein Bca4012_029542 [Brassica carinata]
MAFSTIILLLASTSLTHERGISNFKSQFYLILMNTTRKTETSQRNAEVVMSWRRSRHRAENEDEVCGGSRKWSCRETTARLWFQLMAEEETSDGIGEQGHGREGSGLVSSINSFLNYYLANRFRMWRSREHIYT